MKGKTTLTRGQTTLDFAVGMGIFLIAIAFVFAFVPTLFDPFAGGGGAKLAVANQAASALSGDLLAPSTAGTGALSPGCTFAFFASNDTIAETECTAKIDDVTDLDEMLSLDGRNANVTVHDLDSSTADPVELEWDDGTISMTRSNSGSVPDDVAFAVRTVAIDGQQYRLTVRVW